MPSIRTTKTASGAIAVQVVRYENRKVGVTHLFAYRTLMALMNTLGFAALKAPLLLDLACMRIVEPSSKLRAITLMERYFNIRYGESTIYRILPPMAVFSTKRDFLLF